MTNVWLWSTTAATNATADGSLWAEGQLPSTVNDSSRNNMAAHAMYRKDTSGENVTTGSANAYVLALATTSLAALADGMRFTFRANFSCTGATTLNVNATGAKAIVKDSGNATASGDIVSGCIYEATYVSASTHYRLLSVAGFANQVAGPASSTDKAIARFLGTNGKIVQNSGIIVDDSNNVTAMGTLALTSATATGALIGRNACLSKSGGYTAAAADYGALIVGTSSWTLAITAAATLGAGWWIKLRNNGTGIITIDPNASETISGPHGSATTLKVYPNEQCTIVCDGSNFHTDGLGQRVLLTSTTASASSTVDFTVYDATRFTYYEVELEDVTPGTDNDDFYLRVSTDGGSTFLTTAIYDHNRYGAQNGGAITGGASSGTFAILAGTIGSASQRGISGVVRWYPSAVTATKASWELGYTTNGPAYTTVNGGLRAAAASANAIRFLFSAGTVGSGTLRYYGMR